MIEELKDEIYDALVDNEMSELEMEETIKNILGSDYEVSQFDNWIDDGCDEGEDEYVMGIGFTATDKDNEDTDIRIYYGNNTYEIGMVTFSD